MRTFCYPYHTPTDAYPQSSQKIKFGYGYEFASKPKGPPQISFTLNFKAMFWWFTKAGNISRDVNPTLNIASLIDFYEAHEMYEPFIYSHPTRGDIICRFNKPISTPKSIEGLITYDNGFSGHQVEPFSLELMAQP